MLSHLSDYAIEGALLGLFMVSACVFGVLLGHPGSPAVRRVPSEFARRGLMGLAMGLTAVALIYSPWGQRSGAHMNPATTLAFLWLGKIAPRDSLGYIAGQFVGGVVGVALSRVFLRKTLSNPAVSYVTTLPGRPGVGVAWLAEATISFTMMFVVLFAANSANLTAYTGFFAGALLALFILFEAPLSGMSLNPARTFGSALLARKWRAIWVYFTAPVAGMLLATGAYGAMPGNNHVYCAKLSHCNGEPCIFHCEFGKLQATPPNAAAAH